MIAGSRGISGNDAYQALSRTVKGLMETPEIILHGGARGVDQLADNYAVNNNIRPVIIRPDYSKHGGRVAPIIRNAELVERSTHVIVVYNGRPTPGTANVIATTRKKGRALMHLDMNTGITHTEICAELAKPTPQIDIWEHE